MCLYFVLTSPFTLESSAKHLAQMTRNYVDGQVTHYITTILEPDLGILVACLPLLQPIASKLTRSAFVQRLSIGRASSNGEQSDSERIEFRPVQDGADITASRRLYEHIYRNLDSGVDRASKVMDIPLGQEKATINRHSGYLEIIPQDKGDTNDAAAEESDVVATTRRWIYEG